jgi:hypothetical protein
MAVAPALHLARRTVAPRPLSDATEIFDTDIEDEFEVAANDSPRASITSVSYPLPARELRPAGAAVQRERESQSNSGLLTEILRRT